MPRFMPFPDRPEAVLGYHQVPAEVIEDPEELVAWARKSVEVALRRQVAKAAKPRKTAAMKKPATKKPAPKKRAPMKRAKRPARKK
jgi:hypothetical protein